MDKINVTCFVYPIHILLTWVFLYPCDHDNIMHTYTDCNSALIFALIFLEMNFMTPQPFYYTPPPQKKTQQKTNKQTSKTKTQKTKKKTNLRQTTCIITKSEFLQGY